MTKPFDVTLKDMLEESPPDWPKAAGVATNHAEVIDADVSTISAAADKVLRLGRPPDSLMHLEFQAGPDASLPQRCGVYNPILGQRHQLPVRTVIFLLRPEANLANLTGVYEQYLPGEDEPYSIFRYQIVRVWQLPVGPLLAGGLGTLPLAPVSAVPADQVPEVIDRMKARLRTRPPAEAAKLWAATYVLMGLRYQQAFISPLLQGVMGMKESVTYQAIVEEGVQQGLQQGLQKGAMQELRKTLLLQGGKRFGAPAARVRKVVEGLDDLEQLEQLSLRLLDVGSWQELLGEPTRRPRRKSRP